MSEKSKILWTGICGAALLFVGLWMAMDSASQHNHNAYEEQPKFFFGVVSVVAGIGFLWRAFRAWKEIKRRDAARQVYLSHPENMEHLLAWRKRHTTQDWYESQGDMLEGRKSVSIYHFKCLKIKVSADETDNGEGIALLGLFIVGMSFWPSTHSGIWVGIVFLIFGLLCLVGGVQKMLLKYRRSEREWKEWDDWKKRIDSPSTNGNPPKT